MRSGARWQERSALVRRVSDRCVVTSFVVFLISTGSAAAQYGFTGLPTFSDVTSARAIWPADLDGNQEVGAGDIASLLGDWGATDSPADLSGDGVVGAIDLAELLSLWNSAPPLADEATARGVSWADVDGDGDDDLFVHTWMAPNRFYRNDSGVFVEASLSPLCDWNNGGRAVWADYDNDGDLDVYMAQFGANRLLANEGLDVEGNVILTEIVEFASLQDMDNGMAAAWADYDNDGDLDIYLVNRVTQNLMFRNDDLMFRSGLPVGPLGHVAQSRSATWVDYDNDGDLDLYLVNGDSADAASPPEERRNKLLRNDGVMNTLPVFTDVTTPPLDDEGAGRGAHWADFDFDGDMDVFITNASSPASPTPVVPCALLRNDGVDMMGMPVFTRFTNGPLGDTGLVRDASWVDSDNDGDLDLYLCKFGDNRYLRNDGFEINGDPKFIWIPQPQLSNSGTGGAASWSDYDGDGDMDVYVGNLKGPNDNVLLENTLNNGRHWLQIDLVGVVSPSTPIGARVYVTTDGRTQLHEFAPGSRYMAQDSLTLHFGLGFYEFAESIEVHWPSGIVQTLENVPVNQRMTIVETAP